MNSMTATSLHMQNILQFSVMMFNSVLTWIYLMTYIIHILTQQIETVSLLSAPIAS